MNVRIDCEHRWRYFVDLKSGSVNVRRCEQCGVERTMGAMRVGVEAAVADMIPERMSA